MNVRDAVARLRHADWLLMFATLVLVLFGLAAIYSVALSQEGSDFLNVKKQFLAVGIGLAACVLVSLSNYLQLRNISVLLYAAGCLLLVAVLFFGTTIRGTTGWFTVGPFSFQPVEFMKIVLAVVLATYFSQRARKRFGARELLESAVITAIPVVCVLLQPDLGSAMLLVGTWGIVVLFAGIRKRHLLAVAAVAVATSLLAWNFLFADYQRERILTFLNPSADPLGQGYNVAQAIIAVGSGGWLGRGLGFGSQSQLKFLPESQTDFIFAVIAEELGFLGVSLVLCAFALLLWRMWRHASRRNDDFTSFLLIALGAVFFLQVFVNVGMNVGLLPVTGVGLPLVSYGGSSLIFTLITIGIVQSIAIRSGRDH